MLPLRQAHVRRHSKPCSRSTAAKLCLRERNGVLFLATALSPLQRRDDEQREARLAGAHGKAEGEARELAALGAALDGESFRGLGIKLEIR